MTHTNISITRYCLVTIGILAKSNPQRLISHEYLHNKILNTIFYSVESPRTFRQIVFTIFAIHRTKNSVSKIVNEERLCVYVSMIQLHLLYIMYTPMCCIRKYISIKEKSV